jgi:hypothetical protein
MTSFFLQFSHIKKFGDFFKKLTKSAEFIPEIYSKKMSILSFEMTKVEKNNSGHDLI